MKKTLAKLMALLLVVCMVVPMTAFAAGDTYTVTMQLSGKNGAGDVTTTDKLVSSYVADTSKIVEVLFSLYGGNYSYLQTKYSGTGLGSLVLDGETQYAAGATQWATYVNTTLAATCVTGGVIAILADKEASVGALAEKGTSFEIKFVSAVPESVGNEYTVTLTVNKYVPGETMPVDNGNPVTILGDGAAPGSTEPRQSQTTGTVKDGGTVTSDRPSAPTGEKVTVTVQPDADKMVNSVIIRDKNGNKVPLTYESNGKYSFKMPEGGVSVTTTFRQEPADPAVTGVAALLDTDNHKPFMIGDDKGMFRPEDNITRAETCMIFYRLLRNKNVGALKTFSDVAPNAWYYQAVGTLAAMNIVKGVSATAFEPNRPITRAEFAAICARFAQEHENGKTFPDMQNHWAVDEVGTASYYGWIFGYEDGNFCPDNAITRQEAAAIVNRMLYRLGDQIAIDDGHTKEFPDVNDSMWSWYDIAEATYDHNHEEEPNFAHETWPEA